MKKTLFLLAASLFSAVLFAAGGQDEAQKAGKAPLRLLIVGDSAAKSLSEDDRIVTAIEEKLGIELKVEVVPEGNLEKINVAIASGDFPDVVTCRYPSYSTQKWIEDGILTPLNPYMDSLPAISANAEKESWAWEDGNVYGHLFVGQKGVTNFGMVYNSKWLDNLGLDTPVTFNEHINALRAFTFNDPDGNGQNDTYGITSFKPIGRFNYVFFAHGMKYGDWALKNGEVIPLFEDPSYRKGMTVLKQMWDEGLIDPEFMLNDYSMSQEKLYQGKAGAGVWALYRHVNRIEGNLRKVDPEAGIVYTGGPVGPSGDYGIATNNKVGTLTAVISQSKHPEKAAAFIDFISSPEGRDLLTLGIEGVHYEGSGSDIVYNEEERARDNFAGNGWSHPLAWGFITWPLEAKYVPYSEKNRERVLESVEVATDSQIPNLVQKIGEMELEYGAIVKEIENQYFMDMLLGVVGIDEGLRELSRKWRAQGGDMILEEVNRTYSDMNK